MFVLDECHLLWGDVGSYAWGRTDKRIEIPLKNERQKQTYYGALDYKTKEFLIQPYETANSQNTQIFLDYLRSRRPEQKLVIIWDRASYHRSAQMQKYLTEINQGFEPEQWPVTCLFFAPNAPEQNPVEDIWLQTKSFIRQFYYLCKSFSVVKWLFNFFAQGQIFDFPKLYEYGIFT